MADRPFGCPPDLVLDLPVPPSVNRTRKVNWPGMQLVKQWKAKADMLLIASGQYRAFKPFAIKGPYEITIILDRKLCKADPDNIPKHAIDYIRRRGLIENDSPKYAERTLIIWGEAPEGCRVILRPAEVREAA